MRIQKKEISTVTMTHGINNVNKCIEAIIRW